jgi:hypothetical protein
MQGFVMRTGFETGVLPLIITIFFFSFGAITAGLGFLNVRKMWGRRLTAGIQLMAIVIIIFAPLLKDLIMYDGMFLLSVVFGLASVLFSRSLVYITKAPRMRIISWVLTVLFSAISVVIHGLSFAAAYRFVHGEPAMLVAVFVMIGSIITGVVSLIVNSIEQSL